MRGIPTFPQLRRLREINLNRTYHLLQKPDILICYQQGTTGHGRLSLDKIDLLH